MGAALVAAHGLRGLVVLAVVLVLASAPRTRVWQAAERALVRLTGSRKRAAILVLSLTILVLLAIDLYSLAHG